LVWYQASKKVAGTITGTLAVPTVDGGSTTIDSVTPGATDGVEMSYGSSSLIISGGTLNVTGQTLNVFRYVAVKPGTVIVGGTASPVASAQSIHFDTKLLAIPVQTDIRIAGGTSVHHQAIEFD